MSISIDPNVILLWADSMSVISMVLIVVIPIIIYAVSQHPLMAVRMPGIVIFEVLVNMSLLFIIATQYGSYYNQIWGPCPCFVQNALSVAPNVLLLNVTLARVLVFYRTVQANVLTTNDNPYMEFLVHWLGVLFAPDEFRRLEIRIRHIKMAQADGSQFSNGLGTAKSLMTASSDGSYRTKNSNAPLVSQQRKSKEYIKWVAKMVGWLVIWSVLQFITTYPTDGPQVFLPNSLVFATCTTTSVAWIGSMLIIVCTLHLVIVLSCVKWVNDAFGLKTELIALQVFLTLFWGCDGLLQAIAPGIYSSTGIWTDLSVILFHTLFSFSYPLVLIWQRSRRLKSLKNASIATPEDMMKVWNTSAGRAEIMRIATKKFALESVLFLSETDSLSTSMGHRRINELYQKYLARDAPFELNIPSHLKKEIKKQFIEGPIPSKSTKSLDDPLALSKEDALLFKVLQASRTHVIHMIFTNFKDVLESDLSNVTHS